VVASSQEVAGDPITVTFAVVRMGRKLSVGDRRVPAGRGSKLLPPE
jgi:hypothetical protein